MHFVQNWIFSGLSKAGHLRFFKCLKWKIGFVGSFIKRIRIWTGYFVRIGPEVDFFLKWERNFLKNAHLWIDLNNKCYRYQIIN